MWCLSVQRWTFWGFVDMPHHLGLKGQIPKYPQTGANRHFKANSQNIINFTYYRNAASHLTKFCATINSRYSSLVLQTCVQKFKMAEAAIVCWKKSTNCHRQRFDRVATKFGEMTQIDLLNPTGWQNFDFLKIQDDGRLSRSRLFASAGPGAGCPAAGLGCCRGRWYTFRRVKFRIVVNCAPGPVRYLWLPCYQMKS